MDLRERAKVRAEIQACTACDLHKVGNGPIPFTATSQPTNIVVIGEAPGRVEDEQGAPFIGPAGTLAREWLNGVDAHFMNVVSCWPNRTPHDREVKACLGNVTKQLDFLAPEYVLIFGGVALAALCPVRTRISEARGYWWTLGYGSRSAWAMATWHPAAVLRNRSLEDQAIQDCLVFSTIAREQMVPTEHEWCVKCKDREVEVYHSCGLGFCDRCRKLVKI